VVRDFWRLGDRDLTGDGEREMDTRVLNARSTLAPLPEIAVVAFSESDSIISPSDGGDTEGEVIVSYF